MFPGDVYWRQHFLPGVGVGPVFHKQMTSDTLNKNSVLLARKKGRGGEGNGCGIGNQQCFSHHPHLFWREEGVGGYCRTQKETVMMAERLEIAAVWPFCSAIDGPFFSAIGSIAQIHHEHRKTPVIWRKWLLWLFWFCFYLVGFFFLDNPFVLQTWVKGHKIRPWSKEGEKMQYKEKELNRK